MLPKRSGPVCGYQFGFILWFYKICKICRDVTSAMSEEKVNGYQTNYFVV